MPNADVTCGCAADCCSSCTPHACARNTGGSAGASLYDLIDGALPGGQRFESDDHLRALLRDLVAAGRVEERDDRWKTWQPASLEFTSYRITHHGTALVEQHVDPDPLVEDDRVRPARPRGVL